MKILKPTNKSGHNMWMPVAMSLILSIVLLLLPTGFEGNEIYTESDIQSARIISCDNSAIVDTGLVRSGEQRCTIEILGGMFKGQETTGTNMLNGSLEQDKLFSEGDTAIVRINYSNDSIISVSMIDHYRIPQEVILIGIFCLLLIVFAGKTGIRALLSFIVSILMIWKVLVPSFLKGYNPVWVGVGVVMILTCVIISLIYGFGRKSLASILGCALGIAVTCILGIIFTDAFKIHGAVMSYSESLLYSGYSNLDLTEIFIATIFIGASGAIMDLSVDITSSVSEVVDKRPDLTWKEAVRSGMSVGRAALSSQTTTLLLAYSGGYVTLLMVFMAQGTPINTMFNLKYVSAEILHTIVGSFGLCTVAPLTALTSGFLLTKHEAKKKIAEE